MLSGGTGRLRRLPVELATKLSSRITARLLRAAFAQPPDRPGQAARAAAAGRSGGRHTPVVASLLRCMLERFETITAFVAGIF